MIFELHPDEDSTAHVWRCGDTEPISFSFMAYPARNPFVHRLLRRCGAFLLEFRWNLEVWSWDVELRLVPGP